MKKIRILGTKPYGHWFPVVSWLIRLIEWSKQSHVVIHDLEDNTVIHARFNDIIKEDFDDFIKKNSITESHTIILSDPEYYSFSAFSNALSGKQKGYWQSLIGLIIPQTLRTITRDRIKLDNFWPKGFTCSWFLFVVMVMTGAMVSETCIKYKPTKDEAALSTDDILYLSKKIVDLQKQ
ncbi:MAG: hypothetical protein PHY47_00100 [Lachnospiraceae bacterium]|nr:hypothetical protein [Lachnospiraceae bacterium]